MTDKIKTCVKIYGIGASVQHSIDYIVEEPNVSLNNCCEHLLNYNKYIPTKGDKIFLTSGCDVPRFKVKQFCENFNVSLVKYKEKATVNFVGPDTLKPYICAISSQREGLVYYRKSEVIGYFKKAVGNMSHYVDLLKALDESTSNVVCILNAANEKLKKSILGLPWKIDHIEYQDRPELKFNNKESYEQFIDMIKDQFLVSQNELLIRINTGGIMGKDEFYSIQRMLKSTDKENVKLAMEAMANCDYQKSCVPLLLLVKEYGLVLYDSGIRHHVNFKSLLKFFEITNLASVKLDDIIRSLLKRRLLNKTNLDLLMPLAMEQMRSSTYFSVKEVVYDTEIEEGLNQNILDEICNTEIVGEPEEQITPKNIPQF